MKLTRGRLKQIIQEEVNRLDEMKPEEAAIATAKSAAEDAAIAQGYATAEDAMDKVNGTEDSELIRQIFEHAEAILERASRLSDNAMRAACEATLDIPGLQQIIDNIDQTHSDAGVQPDPSQVMGAFVTEKP